MEPLDVLNMENISYFHLEHPNFYLFYLFKIWDPFISPIIRFMVLKTTGLNPWFQRKKYEVLPKRKKDIFDILLEKLNLDTFLLISQDSVQI